ncbi:ABC transporter substrate-binding protein [Flindersiella endophytica]
MGLDRRRFLQLGGALALGTPLATSLAGCGRGGAGGGDAVRFQGWDFESALVQQNVDRFQKLHKDIKVEYTPITSAQYVQKTVAQFTGGTEPDALYVYDDSLAAWVGAEYLQPLDGLPNLDKVYDAIYPGNAQTMSFQGKKYGLPYYTDSNCLLYNAEILEKAGIKEAPKSLEELTDQARTIQDKGILEYPIGLPAQLSDTWWSWWWALIFASGGEMFDDALKPTMATSDPVVRDIFGWLQDATRKDKVIDPASTQLLPIPLDNAFMAGTYAYTIGARYAARKYNDEKVSKVAGKVKLGFVPSLDGKVLGTVSNTRMYCLSATTEKKEQAYDLLYYLGGYDEKGEAYTAKFWFEKQGLGFAFKELANDPDIKKALGTFADPADVYSRLAEIAKPRRVIAKPWYTEFETESQKTLQGLLSGSKSPSDAVQAMDSNAKTLEKKFS